MRRLLVLGLFALLPACAVDIGDPQTSEEIDSENSGLVQEPEGVPAPDPAEVSPENPQLNNPTYGPTGPTPDPWNDGPDDGPTPDPWVIPLESETQKKTTH